MNKKVLAGIGAASFGLLMVGLNKKKNMIDDKTPESPVTPVPEYQLTPRQRVIEAASSQIGPQDPNKYWQEVLPNSTGFKGAWCGGFALWSLHQAGLGRDIPWEIGKGFCYRLPTTIYPEMGDIAYIDQPYQHHAIVESVNNGMVSTIDGNQPGNTVSRRVRPIGAITAFYSIDPLVQADTMQI